MCSELVARIYESDINYEGCKDKSAKAVGCVSSCQILTMRDVKPVIGSFQPIAGGSDINYEGCKGSQERL